MTCLRQTGLVIAVLTLGIFGIALPGRADDSADRPWQRDKYVVLDRRLIERTENVRLAVGKVEKHSANPLFGEDQPWEVRLDNVYANVIRDEDDGLYKCWYSPFVIDAAVQTTTPEQRKRKTYSEVRRDLDKDKKWQREMGVCYATSQDGLHWDKPKMDVCPWNGQPSNLLFIGPHGTGVFKDSHESDPSRRFKMFNAVEVGFSSDGIHWSPLTPCPEIHAVADTHNNVFWSPELGKYVGITRNWVDGQRVVARTESEDFTKWTKAVEMFRGSSRQRQAYTMIVFPYADAYLGLVMVFDTTTDRVSCELAWSADAAHWERIDEGVPLIGNSETPGDYDWGTVYAAAYPVFLKDGIRLYYGAGNGPHTNWRQGFLALATLRPDGFAGLRPQEASRSGTVETKPLVCNGKSLRVTADAAGGQILAEVCDVSGKRLLQGRAIQSNVSDASVEWESTEGLGPWIGKPVRLRVQLDNATLYAFRFADGDVD